MIEAKERSEDCMIVLRQLIIHSYVTFVEFEKRNVIVKACKAVGSVSDSCFDIRFNPDACSPGIKYTCAHIHTQISVYSVFFKIRLRLNGVSLLQVFVSPLSVLRRFRGRDSCYGTRLLFCCLIRFQRWWV